MEFLRGRSLAARLTVEPCRCRSTQKLDIVTQLCDAACTTRTSRASCTAT